MTSRKRRLQLRRKRRVKERRHRADIPLLVWWRQRMKAIGVIVPSYALDMRAVRDYGLLADVVKEHGYEPAFAVMQRPTLFRVPLL